MTQRKFGKDETISQTARMSDEGDYFFDVFNSALMFDRSPKVQIAHKNKLVSGVEKMPFQEYLAFVSKYLLRLGGTGGSLGVSKESVLFVGEDSVKIAPVICFESAFAEYVSTLVRKGATVLVVITNDGWWKESPGSWQHLGYSRLRAVENRRSIARSANTGISGFINQRGEVVIKTSLNTSQALSASIRQNDEMTFYTRYGDYLGRLSAFLSALIVIYWFVNWFRGK